MKKVGVIYHTWAFLKKVTHALESSSHVEVSEMFETVKAANQKPHFHDISVLVAELPENSPEIIELIHQAVERHPSLLVLVVGQHAEDSQLYSALCAGACGFSLVQQVEKELLSDIKAMLEGGSPMHPAIARQVIRSLWRNQQVASESYLSARERQILQYVSEGSTYHEIADLAGISPHTVHTHMKNIYAKLKVSGRKEALCKAERLGIIHTLNIPRSVG
jgi:DNA-binding NarL/FixJ family response regulator